MTINAATPDGVRLSRDEFGVVHIRATDLAGAHWGMGYCHALDRGMQMLLMRVLGQGRAAECLDGGDETVEVDRFFRRMNWAGGSSEQADALNGPARKLVETYCDGVNARLSKRIPWEFRLLGFKPEPWTPADCVLLLRMTGYLTLAQSQAEIERLLVEMVKAGIDDAKLSELFPVGLEGLDRELLEKVQLGERIVPDSLRWASVAPRMMASNNWVVAPERTASGNALLANDPHLEINRLPNVWVEQVVELPDDTVITANMPGLPGALVGRKKRLAWGATYTFMDAVDSWVEECKDGKYRRGDDWVPFRVREERILRKKRDPVDVTFYENEHGVLDGDPNQPGYYLATRWAPADCGAATLHAAVDTWSAQTVVEGMEAMGRIETAWNWVLADDEGHIGYQMSGKMPVRHPSASGLVPMPGWDSAFDWQGWVDPAQLPRVIDPPDGIIVTANQDLNHLGESTPINMPMGDYRARRIADLLVSGTCDFETFRRAHQDTFSIQAEEMMAILGPLLPDSAPGRLLRDWDRCYQPESRGAALFENFFEELIAEMFVPGLGEPVVRHLQDATGVFIDFYQNFDRLLTAEESAWLGDRSLSDVYTSAFERAARTDRGAWGDTNQVLMSHILLGGKLPKWLGFDRGPLVLPGGRATPHQGQVYQSGGRTTSFAPSLRFIADMGEDVLHTALAGGPSDRRFSRWYVSDLERWKAGNYKKLGRSGD